MESAKLIDCHCQFQAVHFHVAFIERELADPPINIKPRKERDARPDRGVRIQIAETGTPTALRREARVRHADEAGLAGDARLGGERRPQGRKQPRKKKGPDRGLSLKC